MAMNYRIEIPGQRTRRATTLHHAKRAFGLAAGEAPRGTIGEITCDGELVAQGVVDSLGWWSTLDYDLEDCIRLAAGERPSATWQPRHKAAAR